jgi:hypothetical protein
VVHEVVSSPFTFMTGFFSNSSSSTASFMMLRRNRSQLFTVTGEHLPWRTFAASLDSQTSTSLFEIASTYISPNVGKRWSRSISSQFSRVCADATSTVPASGRLGVGYPRTPSLSTPRSLRVAMSGAATDGNLAPILSLARLPEDRHPGG